MSGYLFAYLLGGASVGALWWFWPRVKAEAEADLKKIADDIKEKFRR
jgi:hypothetical protein